MNEIKERIYSRYVDTWMASIKPESLSELENYNPVIEDLIDRFISDDKSQKIIDLGCGCGKIVHYLQMKGFKNTSGVDGSIQQYELAKNLGVKNVEHNDAIQALRDLETGSVDTIIAYDLLEHLDSKELIEFIDEIHRVLKNDGSWIIHIPNADSPFFGSVRYGDITHELAFTSNSIKQLLLASNFTKINTYECAPIPHGLKSAVRLFLWKVFRLLIGSFIIVETGSFSKNNILSRNFYVKANK